MYEPIEDCWFLTGPTASGKTTVGLHLAGLLGAEIISLDSMAIYREMDIGTAKPTPQDRARVTHHLLDIVWPNEDFSLAAYLEAAHRCVSEIRARGRAVLFVGGTPLYLKSLLRGLYEGPPADWEFRRQVRAEVEEVGVAELHRRLQQVDPLSANRLPPTDVRRIIRALEVHRVTGRPISHMQLHFEEGVPAEQRKVFVLSWDRDELTRRIESRVDRMFDVGLLDEIRGLRQRYLQLGRTASQAVGYREGRECLDGTCSEAEARQRVKARTRRFAKRQRTWFRGLSECRFVRHLPEDAPEAVAEAIVRMAESS